MRASELLSIDVAAELRTICSEQLHGLWQLPVELVRYAIRLGAEQADVKPLSRGFSLRCPGSAPIGDQLRRLAVALDPSGLDEGRHEAVVDLEGQGAQALLWVAGVPGVRLRIASRSGGSATVFELRPERRPRLVVDAPDDVPGGFELDCEAPGIDLRRALSWVHTACRFSPIAVTVDGKEVAQGFEENLYSVSLGSPLAGGIALTLKGDAPHLWLLRHGVLAVRATLPDHPPFEAALEMGDVTPENAKPDELRKAVNTHLTALVDRAARLLVDALNEDVGLDPERAERLATLVLRTAIKGIRPEEIERLQAVPAVDLATGNLGRLSLADIRGLNDRGVELWSAPPDTDIRRLPEDERILLRLTDEQHGLLVGLLQASIQRPEPRAVRSGRRFLLGRLRDGLRRAGAKIVGGGGAETLPETQLLAAERRLIDELGRVVVDSDGNPLKARICVGTGQVRVRDGELLLPRHDPLVVQSVRLVDSGEEWLYPAALALLGEEGTVIPEVRSHWRQLGRVRRPG